MPTRRQRQKAYRGWDWQNTRPSSKSSSSKSVSLKSVSSKSSSSSKQMPRQHVVRTRTRAPVPLTRPHTMGGKRRRTRRR